MGFGGRIVKADNLRAPSIIVKILAWAVLGFSLFSALAQTYWLISYTQLAESPYVLVAAGGASAIASLVFWPSVIAVLIWVYLAHANLHRAGLTGLNYSPAWATFSFLVPIANLVVPYLAMRELANRSAGEPEELAGADVDEVFSWWGCWIGSMIFGLVVFYTLFVDLLPGIWVTTPFWATQGVGILTHILTAGSAFFLIKVVTMITRSQMQGASAIAAFE